MSSFFKTLFQFFLPPQCCCCEAFLPEGQEGFCRDCRSGIRWIEPPLCTRCGIPFASREDRSHACGVCLEKPRYFTISRALGHYEGPLREAIHRWKYRGKIYMTPLFGGWMAGRFPDHWKIDQFDIVTPVPLHLRRLRERGFNQALLLAEDLGRRLGIPCRKQVLEKRRPTTPQVSLSGAEREKGVRGAFVLRPGAAVKDQRVLLMDDVYTTGATVNECAKVLLEGGARRVDVFTLAHAVMR